MGSIISNFAIATYLLVGDYIFLFSLTYKVFFPSSILFAFDLFIYNNRESLSIDVFAFN